MNAPAFTVLPGTFVFMTWGGYLITAAGGGGQLVDALQTNRQFSVPIDGYSQFRLWYNGGAAQPTQQVQFALQTWNDRFVTAVDGGGRTSDVFHTDATQISGWETFRIKTPGDPFHAPYHYITTLSGTAVTAVDGGGRTSDALHTNAVAIGEWQRIRILKLGPLGSGLKYRLTPVATFAPLLATNGGGQVHNAIQATYSDANADLSWAEFKFHGQADGSYALETADGHYVTAVNGGGLASTTANPDVLHTDATAAGAWEKFTFLDFGDGTYAIRTTNGHFLSSAAPYPFLSTSATSTADPTTRFSLMVAGI